MQSYKKYYYNRLSITVCTKVANAIKLIHFAGFSGQVTEIYSAGT